MTSKRLDRLEDLYLAASELGADERPGYLDRQCRGDVDLRREVEALLLVHDDADAELALEPDRDLPGPPEQIGPYRILGELGRGGMGTVYLAERKNPSRRVALKVLEARTSRESRLRFRFEVEVLSSLEHPGICRLYESGLDAATDQPYFAMELVAGASLLEYCEAHNTSTGQRLELCVQICRAVHAAHQKGVIHRDLKPANILITESGEPKVLDFGIARVEQADLSITAPHTATGMLIGTLLYMSPEQIEGTHGLLDTRSDIYSLGVVLYELLSGQLPYDLKDKSTRQIQDAICEQDPRPLRLLRREFRGDLDAILLRTLEKSPANRYPSASALASDIERFLRDEPVVARKPGSWYRLKKFSRRHKAVVSAIALVVITSVTAAIFSYWQKNTAERNLQQALFAWDLFKTVLASPDPQEGGRHDLTMLDALDRNVPDALQELERFPRLRPSFQDAVGLVYSSLGKTEKAEQQFRGAVQDFSRFLGPEHPSTLASRNHLAGELLLQAEFDAAGTMLREVIAQQRRTLGPEAAETLDSLLDLGIVLRAQGSFEEAADLCRDVLARQQRKLGDDHPDTIMALNSLAVVMRDLGRFEDCVQMLRQVLASLLGTFGEGHPETLAARHNLAGALHAHGALEKAEDLFRQVLAAQRIDLGEQHPKTLHTRVGLGLVRRDRGHPEEARDSLEEVVAIATRAQGEEHPNTLRFRDCLALVLSDLGDAKEAASIHKDVWVTRQQILGEEHPETLISRHNMAAALEGQSRFEEAAEIYRELKTVRERILGKDHRHTLATANNLGVALRNQGRWEEAIKIHREAEALHGQSLGAEHPDTLMGRFNLAAALHGGRQLEEAEEIYREVLSARERVLDVDHPNCLVSRQSLATLLIERGELQEAAAVHRQGWSSMRGALGEDHPDVLALRANLDAFLAGIERQLLRNLEKQKKATGPDHRETLTAQRRLAQFYLAEGQVDQAIELSEDALDRASDALPEGDVLTADLHICYGLCQIEYEDLLAAEEHLLEGYEALQQALGAGHNRVRKAIRSLIQLYELLDEESAAEYRALLGQEQAPEGF